MGGGGRWGRGGGGVNQGEGEALKDGGEEDQEDSSGRGGGSCEEMARVPLSSSRGGVSRVPALEFRWCVRRG